MNTILSHGSAHTSTALKNLRLVRSGSRSLNSATNRMKARKASKGFTLVELMIVVAIIGILAVLAVFGVSKYLTNAKTAEARNAIGAIAKGAVAAFNEERGDTSLASPGTMAALSTHVMCASATGAVPGTLPGLAKYQTSSAEWAGSGDSKTGFPCLKFEMQEAQYFQYNYAGANAGSGKGGFAITAEADFKGAGTATHGYSIQGKTVGGQLVVDVAIKEAEGAVAAGDKAAPSGT